MKIQCWHIYDIHGYEAIATMLNTGKERHEVLDLCELFANETVINFNSFPGMDWYPVPGDIWNLLWEVEL